MVRPSHLVAFASVGAGLVLSVGCAMSPPADLSPGVDPSIPGIDASNNPLPGDPDRSDAAVSTDDPDAADGSAIDDVKSDAAADAALVDAAPPPGTAPKPTAGEVLITEVMYSTAGPEPASEWFELHNLASSTRNLAGLILQDGASRTHVIVGPLTIASGAYVVLVRNKAAAATALVPAAAIVYEYGTGLADSAGIILANGSTGGISLLNGATVLAAAPYGGWFSTSGGSIQLDVLTAAASTAKASWCFSTIPWAVGAEKGTPGAASNCP